MVGAGCGDVTFGVAAETRGAGAETLGTAVGARGGCAVGVATTGFGAGATVGVLAATVGSDCGGVAFGVVATTRGPCATVGCLGADTETLGTAVGARVCGENDFEFGKA